MATKHPSIKCLGATSSATLDVGMIVRQNLSQAAATMQTLAPLWTDPRISTAWKLVVFNAVIRSMTFYTLETLELTQSQQNPRYIILLRVEKDPTRTGYICGQNLDTRTLTTSGQHTKHTSSPRIPETHRFWNILQDKT